MKNYSFKHPLMERVDHRGENFIQLTGCNRKAQVYLKQVLEFSVLGHRYNELEAESLGNQELIWYCDEKVIKKGEYHYIKIASREDLLYQLSGRKGSLLATFLEQVNDGVMVADYLAQINELLERVAIEYQRRCADYGLDYEFEIKPMTLSLLTQQHLIAYLSHYGVYSSEFMETNYLLEVFLKILNVLLERTATRYLICLEHLSQLISSEEIVRILKNLKQLSEDYDLMIVNIGREPDYLLVEKEDLEAILICGDQECQSFYDWTSILEYIERHYPALFQWREEELLLTLKRVIPYLLSKEGVRHVHRQRDLVVFILLNEGFCFYQYHSDEIDELSPLEMNFLREKLYKS